MDYPLALALVDFLPVLAMTAGISLLVPFVRRTAGPSIAAAALAGGALTVLGGALKAAWKLIVASGGPDIVWMAKAQFFLLGPGFTLLAWALLSTAGRRPPLWAFAAFAAAGLAAAVALGGTWPLLIVTTVSATILGVRLLLLARRARQVAATFLFGFNLLGTYAMGILAGQPEQTIALQWVEESLNTLTWTAFAVGVWRLTRTRTLLTEQLFR
ncbi:hypothetical protein [Nonomuraea cavernae]|uniref:Uncharacterized protein n=1 Tax=Nonomuraea cavernae TaxID=2045107 RepID=A0A917Z940_9ACTN|nr:hypothetical protein [Nonomuraea cavernae]MCA2188851.1 hypothetical protein [Nonomuraea cavernae]GGO78433.1 hypothetical protein GCM10012289_60400 [Nonomuraea cavernae]